MTGTIQYGDIKTEVSQSGKEEYKKSPNPKMIPTDWVIFYISNVFLYIRTLVMD